MLDFEALNAAIPEVDKCVGQTVWIVANRSDDTGDKGIVEARIIEIHARGVESESCIRCYSTDDRIADFRLSVFNKNAYPTREAAEQALSRGVE